MPAARTSFARRLAFSLLPLTALLLAGSAAADSALQNRLRVRLEAGLVSDSLTVGGERLYARDALRRAYADIDFKPMWVDENGLDARGQALADWLAREPERQGLRPEDYHVAVIRALHAAQEPGAAVDLELALSDAFLTVGAHLTAGRLDPTTLDPQWIANPRTRDLVPDLERAGASDAPGAVLEELLPRAKAYSVLVDYLAALRRQRDAGGWPSIPPGPALHPGDSGERVASLARRLAAEGDLPAAGVGGDYDAMLTAAVARFQSRHGLTADGVAGPGTLRELAVPIDRRIDQVAVNLERWRWLPENLGQRYVLVNIAGFELEVVEDGRKRLDMRVVVGTPYRRTPVFSGRISYVVLNPYWEVPPKIAVQDKLPLIKANPNYLRDQRFEVLQGWGAAERVVDPSTVDWSKITARNFPYRLRQLPGATNALGRIKFMFPNPFSVYLHDTPTRDLFAKESRSFSSGCIRLDRPLDLAEYLLADAGWTRTALQTAIASGRQLTIPLKTQVPVHLLYWTVWTADDGTVEFRKDIYDRDSAVLRELQAAPPRS